MPNGRIHDFSQFLLAASTSVGVLLSPEVRGFLGPHFIFLVAGELSGILITPDLDLAENTPHGTGRIYRELGWLPSRIWKYMWWPYGKAFRHRSKWSHAPIVGTLIRVAYLCAITFGFFGQVGWIIKIPAFWWWMLGLCFADLLHFTLDSLF